MCVLCTKDDLNSLTRLQNAPKISQSGHALERSGEAPTTHDMASQLQYYFNFFC